MAVPQNISRKLERQLLDYQSEPLKVDDLVKIPKKLIGFGGSSKSVEEIVTYKIVAVDGDLVQIVDSDSRQIKNIPVSFILKKDDFKVGINPIKSKKVDVRFLSFTIQSLITSSGYESYTGEQRDTEIDGKMMVPEMQWNPYIMVDGEKKYYQRGLEWSLEDKQNLIDSIYNGRSIGTFIIRLRSFDWVQQMANKGERNIGFRDIVDGKQRLDCLVKFIQNKFADKNGNKFGDFSLQAKKQFLNYGKLSYGELDESCTDAAAIETFLNINIKGVKVSDEHIEKVEQLEKLINEETN